MDQMLEIADLLSNFAETILKKSNEYLDALAPGFTHLQHAQPISFGQELAKHAVAIERDLSRIRDWYQRSNTSPLGAGALSGSSLPISPESTAKVLGFSSVALNSIDAVSDRDFAAEALFIMALIGVHLSRIGEEWTLWCSSEFGWARLDDAYATGSSIMPQKKNPDVAELARGKAGPLVGNLTSLLVTLKGLPFAYNRDLQEDKEVVFSSLDHLQVLIPALTGMVATTSFDRGRMERSAPESFSLATEIADYLVRQSVPFAIAHEAAGKCVKICEEKSIELHELTDTDFASIHEKLDARVREYLTVAGAVSARASKNGTSPKSVSESNKELAQGLGTTKVWISNEKKRFSGMMSQ